MRRLRLSVFDANGEFKFALRVDNWHQLLREVRAISRLQRAGKLRGTHARAERLIPGLELWSRR